MGSSGGLWWPHVFWASLENQTVPWQGIPASKPMAIWDILWVWVDLKVSDPRCIQLANWDLEWKLGTTDPGRTVASREGAGRWGCEINDKDGTGGTPNASNTLCHASGT